MDFSYDEFDIVQFQIKYGGVVIFTSQAGTLDTELFEAGLTGTIGDFSFSDCSAFLLANGCPTIGDEITVCYRGYNDNECSKFDYSDYIQIGDGFQCVDTPTGGGGDGDGECLTKEIKTYQQCQSHFYPITGATTVFEVALPAVPAGAVSIGLDKFLNVLINGVGQNATAGTDYSWAGVDNGDGTATVTVEHTPGEPDLPCFVDVFYQMCITYEVATCG